MTLTSDDKRILILERRLSRLEKMIKNESAEDDIFNAATQWAKDYIDQLDEDDYWVQEAGSIYDTLQMIADEAADPVVDSCCDDLESEYAFELSDSDRDVVVSALAAAAEEAMQYIDEEFESIKRVSKKSVKSEASKKPVKKESVKRNARRSLVSIFRK